MFTLLLSQRDTYFKFFWCLRECAKCCFPGCVPVFRTYSWWHVQRRQNGPMQSLFVRACLTWLEGLRADDLTSLFHTCMRSDARVRRLFYICVCIAWWHSVSKKESHHSNVTAHQPFCLSEEKPLYADPWAMSISCVSVWSRSVARICTGKVHASVSE